MSKQRRSDNPPSTSSCAPWPVVHRLGARATETAGGLHTARVSLPVFRARRLGLREGTGCGIRSLPCGWWSSWAWHWLCFWLSAASSYWIAGSLSRHWGCVTSHPASTFRLTTSSRSSCPRQTADCLPGPDRSAALRPLRTSSTWRLKDFPKLDLGQHSIDEIEKDLAATSVWDGPAEREKKEKLKLERILDASSAIKRVRHRRGSRSTGRTRLHFRPAPAPNQRRSCTSRLRGAGRCPIGPSRRSRRFLPQRVRFDAGVDHRDGQSRQSLSRPGQPVAGRQLAQLCAKKRSAKRSSKNSTGSRACSSASDHAHAAKDSTGLATGTGAAAEMNGLPPLPVSASHSDSGSREHEVASSHPKMAAMSCRRSKVIPSAVGSSVPKPSAQAVGAKA